MLCYDGFTINTDADWVAIMAWVSAAMDASLLGEPATTIENERLMQLTRRQSLPASHLRVALPRSGK
jgi:hypothetical protein